MSNLFSPKTVLITGATGSIGGALAEAYAAPERILILQGRNEQRLKEVADLCRQRGARVNTQALDVQDIEALRCWIRELCDKESIDLAIPAAGINSNIGANGQGETWEQISTLVEINVLAAMAVVDAVLPSMRDRQCGQIALFSSLAAYYGLPLTPSYSASKAAIKAYGEALRGWLAPEGIGVNVIMPGYVESKMCREMPGPKPFLWSPERAAMVIKRGLASNKARISFPFPLNLGTWYLSVLPAAISERILHLLGYDS
ncbi:MAG: SDR family NAD(P)-dependent oxidoreductase [Desulfobulbus sp.]|nr:SDR family NAD(P)-dependent oxidoreductase [Desulfobulbus sp.]